MPGERARRRLGEWPSAGVGGSLWGAETRQLVGEQGEDRLQDDGDPLPVRQGDPGQRGRARQQAPAPASAAAWRGGPAHGFLPQAAESAEAPRPSSPSRASRHGGRAVSPKSGVAGSGGAGGGLERAEQAMGHRLCRTRQTGAAARPAGDVLERGDDGPRGPADAGRVGSGPWPARQGKPWDGTHGVKHRSTARQQSLLLSQ